MREAVLPSIALDREPTDFRERAIAREEALPVSLRDRRDEEIRAPEGPALGEQIRPDASGLLTGLPVEFKESQGAKEVLGFRELHVSDEVGPDKDLRGRRGSHALRSPRLLLSDYVFDETMTTLRVRSRRHDVAVRAGTAIRDSRILGRIEVDRAAFDAAWDLFRDRPDKEWSFTECTSFVLMERLAIRKALTFDRNFREAGFAALP